MATKKAASQPVPAPPVKRTRRPRVEDVTITTEQFNDAADAVKNLIESIKRIEYAVNPVGYDRYAGLNAEATAHLPAQALKAAHMSSVPFGGGNASAPDSPPPYGLDQKIADVVTQAQQLRTMASGLKERLCGSSPESASGAAIFSQGHMKDGLEYIQNNLSETEGCLEVVSAYLGF